jgi:hypothetical protein
MSESDTTQRLLYALLGFVLGGLVTASASWWFADSIVWWAVGAGAGACAVLAFCFGEPFVEWLREVWWRS